MVVTPSLLLDYFPPVSQLIAYWHLLQRIGQNEKDLKGRPHQPSHLGVSHFLSSRCGVVRLSFHYAQISVGEGRVSGSRTVIYFICLLITCFYSLITELSV